MKKLSKHIKNSQILNQEKSPFSQEDILSILGKVDAADKQVKSNINRNTKMGATFGSIIALVLGAWGLLSNLHDNNNEIKPATNQVKNQTVNQNNNVSNLALAKQVDKLERPKNAIANKIIKDTLEQDLGISKAFFFDLDPTGKDKKYVPVPVLTKEELKKLYVYLDDDGLYFIDESTYPPYKFNRDDGDKELQLKGYPTKGTLKTLKQLLTKRYYNLLLPYDGADMQTSMGIFPLLSMVVDSSERTLNVDRSEFALIDSKLNRFEPLICLQDLKAGFNKILKCNNNLNSNYIIYLNYTQILKHYLKDYRLVVVPHQIKNKNQLVIFVFPSTSNLNKLLPERFKALSHRDAEFTGTYKSYEVDFIRNKMDGYLANIDRYKRISDSVSKLEVTPKNVQKNIAGIGKLKLTAEELKALNIISKPGMITFPVEEKLYTKSMQKEKINELISKYNYKISDDYILKRSIVKHYLCDYKFNEEEILINNEQTEYSKVSPIGFWMNSLVKKSGNEKTFVNIGRMYQSPIMFDVTKSEFIDTDKFLISGEEGRNIPTLSRMIKIDFVDSCGETNPASFPQISLFFYANKEFVSLLPDRYRIPLEKEIKVLDDIESGQAPAAELCQTIKGQESYLGVCSLTSSNIVNAKVYPNPTNKEAFYVDLVLLKDAKISVDLYDSLGDLIFRLKDNLDLKGGKNKITIDNDLSKLPAGMYIISFTDANGERVTRNVAIK